MKENKEGNMAICNALHLIRVIKGYKAKEMAAAIGISSSYYSQIESGRKKPSLEIIEKFAKAIGESPSTILYFSEEYSEKRSSLTNFTCPAAMDFLRKLGDEKRDEAE